MMGGLPILPLALLWSWLMAMSLQQPFGKVLFPHGFAFGLFTGALSGLILAFIFKGETATVDVPKKTAFVARLNVATSQLGYYPATHAEDFFTYKPSFQAGLAAGRISVQLEGGQAVIVGPKMYVKKLLKRLAGD
jgi:hypothetical protein